MGNIILAKNIMGKFWQKDLEMKSFLKNSAFENSRRFIFIV